MTKDDSLALADKVLALINSSPRTPSREEIAGLLGPDVCSWETPAGSGSLRVGETAPCGCSLVERTVHRGGGGKPGETFKRIEWEKATAEARALSGQVWHQGMARPAPAPSPPVDELAVSILTDCGGVYIMGAVYGFEPTEQSAELVQKFLSELFKGIAQVGVAGPNAAATEPVCGKTVPRAVADATLKARAHLILPEDAWKPGPWTPAPFADAGRMKPRAFRYDLPGAFVWKYRDILNDEYLAPKVKAGETFLFHVGDPAPGTDHRGPVRPVVRLKVTSESGGFLLLSPADDEASRLVAAEVEAITLRSRDADPWSFRPWHDPTHKTRPVCDLPAGFLQAYGHCIDAWLGSCPAPGDGLRINLASREPTVVDLSLTIDAQGVTGLAPASTLDRKLIQEHAEDIGKPILLE
jgi:hypothetical protein